MQKQHLFLIEDVIIDPFSIQGHEKIVDELNDLKRLGEIDFIIKVPAELTYQFFIYYEDISKINKVVGIFKKNKVFYREEFLL